LVRRLEKALQLAVQLMRARYALKTCDRVGVNARVAGALRVQNHGSIVVGDHLNINSVWVPTELVTGPAGYIEIGDDVLINFGTVIAAGRGVSIGSGSMIGPHCIISDMDIPEAVDDPQSFLGKPIFIGKDVWLAGRVTVRPGVTIGDGAVVAAGSIVESDVPANVMALGIPARLLPKLMTAPRPTPEAEVSPSGEPIARRYAVPLDKRVRETAVEGAGSHDEAARRVNGTLISDFALDELAQELAADERTAVAVEFLRGDVAASWALEP
jgi:acetyltransferase-like isoleucine patch superfamily enzyme